MTAERDVVIVGDGPTGLSAALFLAKNGMDVVVYGKNETALHKALLLNYLGIDEEDGTSFIERARDQAERFGAALRDGEVTELDKQGDGFVVRTSEGESAKASYLVLATGWGREIGEPLGLDYDGDVIAADKEGHTSLEHVYAGGAAIRPHKTQAAISVGDGAAIALSILSEAKGEPFHDFDVPA